MTSGTQVFRWGWIAWLGVLCGFRGVLMADRVASDAHPWQTELTARIAASKAPGAFWGCQVVSLKDDRVLFETNASRLFVPASTAKLFTLALALDRFGSRKTFDSEWRMESERLTDGTVAGDVWLVAGGDPAPGGGALTEDSLQAYAVALSKAGVRQVRGGVRIDASRLDASPFGPGWDWDDLPEAYGASAGTLQYLGNAVAVIAEPGSRVGDPGRVRTSPMEGVFDMDAAIQTVTSNQPARLSLRRMPGSRRLIVRGQIPAGKTVVERMSVPDAEVWFARGLQHAFRSAGIRVEGGFAAGTRVPGGTRGVAAVPSSSLSDLAALCLKRSNNQIAQMLWLQVGADVRLAPRPGDAREGEDDNERAARALGRFVARMGIASEEVAMEEGAGLSRKDLLTPRATVQLLRRMASGPDTAVWMSALPVGGVDGTLKGRFTQDTVRGRVVAKTGSMSHVNSLAGYVTTAQGERLAFAIFVNGYLSADEAASSRSEIDRWVALLVDGPR